MQLRQSQRWLSILLCLVLVFAVTGCSKKSPAKPIKPKQQESTAGQKPKPPKTADSMKKEIDKVLQELDKKARQERMPQMTEQTQPQAGQKGAGSAGKQSSGESQGQDQGQQGKKGSTGQKQQSGQQQGEKKPSPSPNEQPKPEQEWQPITASLIKIHQTWNQMEPEATKAGMTSKDRDAFEAALDKLTQAASKQKLPDSMKAAIELYRDFGTIVSYFAYPLPRDYFIVNYEVMGVMAAAFTGNWATADEHIKNLEEPWMRLQMQLPKDKKADIDRTTFSIKDLTQAVAQKDVDLTFIKGEIVLKNLKKFEQKTGQKQGQEQG